MINILRTVNNIIRKIFHRSILKPKLRLEVRNYVN